MTELKPISGLYAIEVSDTSEDFIINEGWLEYVDLSREEYEGNVWVALTEDPYEILFTTKNFSEENAKSILEPEGPHFNTYQCYLEKNQSYDCASMSLKSLLRANGLDQNKNYLLIKKQDTK